MSEQDPLQVFRTELESLIIVLERFSPLCKTPDELVGMLRLALTNEAQARFLLRELTPLSKR